MERGYESEQTTILFLDRDGTLIIEPEDQQIDSLEKLLLVDAVIPALLQLKVAGYEFVIVSNQDGLGTASNPLEKFQPPHDKMLALFASQGIDFVAEHIDPHFEGDGSPDRKPGIGMVLEYLKSGEQPLLRSVGSPGDVLCAAHTGATQRPTLSRFCRARSRQSRAGLL